MDTPKTKFSVVNQQKASTRLQI